MDSFNDRFYAFYAVDEAAACAIKEWALTEGYGISWPERHPVRFLYPVQMYPVQMYPVQNDLGLLTEDTPIRLVEQKVIAAYPGVIDMREQDTLLFVMRWSDRLVKI